MPNKVEQIIAWLAVHRPDHPALRYGVMNVTGVSGPLDQLMQSAANYPPVVEVTDE